MRLTFLLAISLCFSPALAKTPSSWGQPTDTVAFTKATIMVAPGQTQKGTLLVANGKVVATGPDVAIPKGARVIDASGKVIHAGFLDPYLVESRLHEMEEPSEAPQLAERVHDQERVSERLLLDSEAFQDLRELGFVAVAVVPERGIVRGRAALYHTSVNPRPAQENLLQADLASVVGFEPLGWEKLSGENYPLSLMGNVAFVRQLFLDSAWYDRHRDEAGIELSATLESLAEVRSGERLLLSESTSFLDVLRLVGLWKELALPKTAIVLSGQEWQGLDPLVAGRAPGQGWILPVAFPETPKESKARPTSNWGLSELRQWQAAPGVARWLHSRGQSFALSTHRLEELGDLPQSLADLIAAGLPQDAALAALTTEPAKLLGVSGRFGTLTAGKSASFVVRTEAPFSGKGRIEEVWVEGRRHPHFDRLVEDKDESDPVQARAFIQASEYASAPVLSPAEVFRPTAVLVRGATLWTGESTAAPTVADLLVSGGKIAALGQGLSAPAGAHVIDGRGLHLTPGIIDAHSHTAIEGDVNEPGRNVTAMVAIKDVLNPFDHDIYLQLASGVTTANILHGSANASGGQSIIAKWTWGATPQEMVMKGAPEGIKFALGENPKQSNWGDVHSSRYPQSRLGVNELVRGSFATAKNYRAQKEAGLDPEPDLVSEALLEVLDGKRLIHCHSYRQDEILALLRLAEQEGFKIATFQHVLEGYKVADEIAAHGAGASTFADWWAYKVEVEDAIPHNAALMQERGVLVSINSDSGDLARRLNTEAGKSVRYGGISEPQALAFITRNPAEQLGILQRTGTLAVGKDADFVLWNAPPLSQKARCLETWIEGARYYTSAEEASRAAAQQAERARLIELTKRAKEKKS